MEVLRNLVALRALTGLSMALAAFGPTTVSAKNMVPHFTGTQLYGVCKSADKASQGICEGYIAGVYDTIFSGYLSTQVELCVPRGVTPIQLRLQLVKFLESNPDLMHFVAEGVVAKSLQVKYSCPKGPNSSKK